MLFSIIVPIYKVEKYLPQCIESVLKQDFSDFELILVDDGSPDNSGTICDEYAAKDNRIKVIHKINGGLSDARNAGISIARGNYIWFLDSDDYMANSVMFSIAEIIINDHEIDMITCAHIDEVSDGKTELELLPYSTSLKSINRNEFLLKLYKSNGAYWDAWKNIFKRSIIDANNLRFTKGLIGAEDCSFFIHFVQHGKKFSFCNIPIVNYRINREGSITNIMSKAAIMGQLIVFKENYSSNEIENVNECLFRKVFFSNKFANVITLLYHLKSRNEIVEVTNYIKEHNSILKDTKGVKYDAAKLIWLLFGYYNGSKLIKIINLRTR